MPRRQCSAAPEWTAATAAGPFSSGNNPLSPSGGTIDLVIDEDQLRDSERNHTTEQVAYFVIDPPLETQSSSGSPSVRQKFAVSAVLKVNRRAEAAVGKSGDLTNHKPLLGSVQSKLAAFTSGRIYPTIGDRIGAIEAVIAAGRETEEQLPDDLLNLLAETTAIERSLS